MSEGEMIPLDIPAVALMRAPEYVIKDAQRAAKALLAVVEAKPEKERVVFNGKRYIDVNDYQTLAAMFGLTAKPVVTERIEIGGAHGYYCRSIVIRTSDGAEVGAGDSMCMSDEEQWGTRPKYEWMHESKAPEGAKIAWQDGDRVKVHVGEVPVPEFQRRSMAQTRACGKGLRLQLGYVVVLAGFDPSAIEEMTGRERDGLANDKPAKPPIKPPQRRAGPTAPAASDGAQEVVGLITNISTKDGTNRKGPWTRWGVQIGGVYYGTFSESIAGIAMDAKAADALVVLVFKEEGGHKNVVSIEEREPSAAATELDF